jgi:hypothetical protein
MMIAPRCRGLVFVSLLACTATWIGASAARAIDAGFATVDVTPELDPGRPIWLAGLEKNRAATGVHDRLFARAVVLRTRSKKVALVSADSIGLPYPLVQRVREKLKDFNYVLVAATHSHATPDVIGIWGPSDEKSGVVPSYVEQLETGIVDAVRKADSASGPATAEFGTAEDESLLGDFRLPEVYDGVLRILRFHRVGKNGPSGIVVQWNSHGIEPSNNPLITRDFMGSMVDALEQRHGCPVIYFQGAIGGLMGTPKKLVEEAKAGRLPADTFGFIDAVGAATADLADRALAAAQPIELAPLAVFTKTISLPLDNRGFVQALAIGVLSRPAFEWTGDKYKRGDQVAPHAMTGRMALETEVAYLQLGELAIAAIPGELYPECVYGKYQDPVDPGADFLNAPREPSIAETLPSGKFMMIGLANDEVGYIVPKRQWDVRPPYAYNRESAQYGERNSVGPETAGLILNALSERVADAQRQAGDAN